VEKTRENRALWSVLLTKYYSGDQIKMNDLDGACGMYGRKERCIQGFSGEMRERNQLEDLGIDGRIILKWMLRKWGGGLWTGLIWLKIRTGGRLL